MALRKLILQDFTTVVTLFSEGFTPRDISYLLNLCLEDVFYILRQSNYSEQTIARRINRAKRKTPPPKSHFELISEYDHWDV